MTGHDRGISMVTMLTAAHWTPAPETARRPALKSLRRALWPAKEPQPNVAPTYDQFGHSLYLLACVLTDDTKLAEQLVVQTILEHQSGPSTLRELSAGIHVAWLAGGQPPLWAESSPLAETSSGVLALHDIYRLAADQRAALGLCKYGGHTHRQAADLLDVAPEQVARLLCDALRILATSSFKPSPAA
ncbi:MAG: sigma-70 region 4 domain-containing protein [Kineosporiaceae bacterium]|nr:sigma-70 region 4 domain-containing protein [Aeromicrobium sp.]